MEKKLPLRLCLGCNNMLPKNELLRIVKNKDKGVFVDTGRKTDGRGAYLCKSAECLGKAKKNRRLEKAFKCRVDNEIYDQLQTIINN